MSDLNVAALSKRVESFRAGQSEPVAPGDVAGDEHNDKEDRDGSEDDELVAVVSSF